MAHEVFQALPAERSWEEIEKGGPERFFENVRDQKVIPSYFEKRKGAEGPQ